MNVQPRPTKPRLRPLYMENGEILAWNCRGSNVNAYGTSSRHAYEHWRMTVQKRARVAR